MAQSNIEELIALVERTLKVVSDLLDDVAKLERKIDALTGEDKPKILN